MTKDYSEKGKITFLETPDEKTDSRKVYLNSERSENMASEIGATHRSERWPRRKALNILQL